MNAPAPAEPIALWKAMTDVLPPSELPPLTDADVAHWQERLSEADWWHLPVAEWCEEMKAHLTNAYSDGGAYTSAAADLDDGSLHIKPTRTY